MSKAYRLKADASFPRPLRSRQLPDGNTFWEVAGVSYTAGDVITDDVMLPRDVERAANGELDFLLEEISEVPASEPVKAEHEAEREILLEAGKEVAGEKPGLTPPAPKPKARKPARKQNAKSAAKQPLQPPVQAPTANEVIG